MTPRSDSVNATGGAGLYSPMMPVTRIGTGTKGPGDSAYQSPVRGENQDGHISGPRSSHGSFAPVFGSYSRRIQWVPAGSAAVKSPEIATAQARWCSPAPGQVTCPTRWNDPSS